jgi:hypothetical protein
MTAADELADLRVAATGVGPGKSLAAKVASAQAAQASGDVAGACATLGDFIAEVAAQTRKKIPEALARALTAEAQAVRNALPCQ